MANALDLLAMLTRAREAAPMKQGVIGRTDSARERSANSSLRTRLPALKPRAANLKTGYVSQTFVTAWIPRIASTMAATSMAVKNARAHHVLRLRAPQNVQLHYAFGMTFQPHAQVSVVFYSKFVRFDGSLKGVFFLLPETQLEMRNLKSSSTPP